MEANLSGRHVCKLCNKSFACGRSLGGHMRSHLTNNLADNHQDEKKDRVFEDETDLEGGNFGYVLRKNPKKTHKLEFMSEESSHEEKFCREKWNSNSEEEFEDQPDSHITDSKQKLVMDIQSDNESEAFNKRRKRSSSSSTTRRRTSQMGSVNSNSFSFVTNSSSVSEIEQEHEVAVSLMLLSMDVGFNSPAESFDNNSKFLESKTSVSNDCIELVKSNKLKKNYQKPQKKTKKRNKFECGICNKNFDSYQALGGHRASHKKQKGCYVESTAIEDDEEEMVKVSKGKMGIIKNCKKMNKHKCPICEKVFASGQALGGHKRSHLINGTEAKKKRESIQSQKDVHEIRGFLDLNLPPQPVERETMDHNLASLNPWWVAATEHKHQPVLNVGFHI